MERTIRIIEAVNRQVLKDQDKWIDQLKNAWPFVSFFIGKAFDLPVYSFKHFGDTSLYGSGTLVLAVKEPAGTLKFYHPLGCLFSEGKTIFDERILVKLITFVEEQIRPVKKPDFIKNDVFQYLLKQVNTDAVSNFSESRWTPEVKISVADLIEKVKNEI